MTSNIPLKRATKSSAGYDLCSIADMIIAPKTLMLIPTGVVVEIPDDCVFILKTKSRHLLTGGYVMNPNNGVTWSIADAKANRTPAEFARLMEESIVYTHDNISVEGGVIDSDYRKPIFVALRNNSSTEPFYVRTGDAIAQGIILKYGTFTNEVGSEADRNGGFGSTDN